MKISNSMYQVSCIEPDDQEDELKFLSYDHFNINSLLHPSFYYANSLYYNWRAHIKKEITQPSTIKKLQLLFYIVLMRNLRDSTLVLVLTDDLQCQI